MTVKELREALAKLPQDAVVEIFDWSTEDAFLIKKVEIESDVVYIDINTKE